MYSDMSKRISAWSLPNRKLASARASSVLPTPVGPRNTKLPTGRFGFLRPARERRIARESAEIAFSWLMTRLVQLVFHAQQLVAFVLVDRRHRHAGPLRDDLVDLGLADDRPCGAFDLTSNFSRTNCRFSRACTSCSR